MEVTEVIGLLVGVYLVNEYIIFAQTPREALQRYEDLIKCK